MGRNSARSVIYKICDDVAPRAVLAVIPIPKSATKSATISDAEMDRAVEETVAANVAVVRGHRNDRFRKLVHRLGTDLEDTADCQERIIELINQEDTRRQPGPRCAGRFNNRASGRLVQLGGRPGRWPESRARYAWVKSPFASLPNLSAYPTSRSEENGWTG